MISPSLMQLLIICLIYINPLGPRDPKIGL
jgi:hypothetical protein